MRTKTLVAMIACLMLLCSCALAEDVTIQFWHHYSAQSAENETLMNVLIPAFEAENPGIKVNAVSHEWAELHDKVLVSAKSNALPDVARCDIAWLPEFQKMGILTALDKEMEGFAEASGALLPSAMSTAVIDGHNYALALNYNEECVPGQGSAIFLHCFTANPDNGSAGCIRLPEERAKELVMSATEQTRIIIARDLEHLR